MHSSLSSALHCHCSSPSSPSNLSSPSPPTLTLPSISHLPAFVIDCVCPCCRLMCLDFSPQSYDNWMSALCPPILVTWTSQGEKNPTQYTNTHTQRNEARIGKKKVLITALPNTLYTHLIVWSTVRVDVRGVSFFNCVSHDMKDGLLYLTSLRAIKRHGR